MFCLLLSYPLSTYYTEVNPPIIAPFFLFHDCHTKKEGFIILVGINPIIMALSTLKKKPELGQYLCNLNASYRLIICQELDVSEGWDKLLCLLPTGTLDHHEIHIVKSAPSPSEKLIFHVLGNERGWSLRHLVKYLELIEHETLLAHFKSYEAPVIRLQPLPYIVAKAGSVVKIETFASGFPRVRYDWFFQNVVTKVYKQLNFKNPNLIINNPTVDKTGLYICRVYNLNDDTLAVVWTNDCFVKILPQPENVLPFVASSAIAYETESAVVLSGSHGVDANNPLPTVIAHPQSINVKIGEQVILQFVVKNADKFAWFKNGKELNNVNTPNFEISCVEPEDEGFYFCIASNNFGTIKSKQAELGIKSDANLNLDKPHILHGPVVESSVHIGEVAVFNVVAQGLKPLTYNWFKDGKYIESSRDSELHVNILNKSWGGKYCCTVTDRNGQQTLSPSAELRVFSKRTKPYVASDKIFVAVGCSTYHCMQPLSAPKFDLCTLKKKFEEMNFKTIVLHDLDLKACLRLVDKVKELIDKNVYVVAYFAGHGFKRDGQQYFLPVDCPINYKVSDCLCIEYVLRVWQERVPALIAVFADFCRDENPNQDRSEMEKFIVPVHGNQIILYATCKIAYEIPTTSFFVSLLELELTHDKPLINLCNEVICKMPKHKENFYQEMYPNLLSNLNELRSLHDPIENGTGISYELYQKITNRPESLLLSIEYGHERIRGQVKFSWDVICDNVLCVMAEIVEFYVNDVEKSAIVCVVQTETCLVATSSWWSKVENKVEGMPGIENSYYHPENCNKTLTFLTEIEKIDGSLSLKLVIKYEDRGNTMFIKTGPEPAIEFYDIMIMPWNLSQDIAISGRKGEPEESMEPPSSDYSGLPVTDTVGFAHSKTSYESRH
ncbi:mucosa-associated lymphoid tissue lymphoma translocation protein 1 homolog [Tubulanus polymorphus]|uniref:mucosa-associated lymphoid tissue lymphoma translocation protein 1 homolog n=1 Tax=Tubulanus polymorphus TaxID=672921 RepID=UPI003DA22434